MDDGSWRFMRVSCLDDAIAKDVTFLRIFEYVFDLKQI